MPRTKAKRPQGHTSEGNGKRTPDLAYIAEPLRSLAVAIQSLSPDPANARTHPERNLDAIRGSLALFGQVKPVVVRKETGTVVCGNGTLAAAQALGWTHLAAVIKSMDQATATALAIADNQTAALAEWDNAVLDKLLADLVTGQPELDAMLAELAKQSNLLLDVPEPGAGGDEFDATPDDGPTRTRPGDLWIIGGKHRLLCGDSTKAEDVARVMGGEKAGLCFTSPPYNAGKYTLTGNVQKQDKTSRYDGFDDDLPEDEYVGFLEGFTKQALSVCEVVAVNIQQLANNKFAVLKWIALFLDNFIDRSVWYKGHGNPAMAENVMASRFEDIWLLSPNQRPSRAIATASFRGTVENVIESSGASAENTTPEKHAATMPMAVANYAIESWTQVKTSVYDPFLGSGTTLIAAHRLGRKAYGIEIEPKYCDVILKRAEAEGLTVEKG